MQLGAMLVLQKDDEAKAQVKAGTIFISVNDVNQCRARIIDRLGLAVSPVVDKAGRKAFACHDPDGYVLKVFQR